MFVLLRVKISVVFVTMKAMNHKDCIKRELGGSIEAFILYPSTPRPGASACWVDEMG